MKQLLKVLRLGLLIFGTLALAGISVILVAYLYVAPTLPSAESLKDVRFQVPLRVYSKEGQLIAEFGEMKRTPVSYQEIPELMIKAVLAAEDDRFFVHPGVDYQGILRAAFELVKTGEKRQGGSTITMQVARNFFLSSEKTYLRKLNEVFLALKIEHELSKQEILELYLNKIYLGKRAYGVAAAAQVYYGTTLDQLTVAQTAMIAGLPKAPSAYNPLADPQRAIIRRNYVLGRMHDLGFISDEVFTIARSEPVTAKHYALETELQAPYVAEMVRSYLVSLYGDDAYTSGYNVITTVSTKLQRAANKALQAALLEYDARHGYRGPERHVALAANAGEEQWRQAVADIETVGGLEPAVVTAIGEETITTYTPQDRIIEIPWEQLSWARPYIDDNRVGAKPRRAADIVRVGDIVRLQLMADNQWRLAQLPLVEGALVSLDPHNGAILALTGGFDFNRSKFNRVMQADRQAGSSLKPFIYSAALEKGFTPASLINDAPVVFDDPALESVWRPENYSGKFFGPTRLRVALTQSRNLVSIRLLRAIGIPYAIDYLSNFGFDKNKLPRNLSLALGSAAVKPVELGRAFATFANGGYLISPVFIDRIENIDGEAVVKANPVIACQPCEEAPVDNTAETGNGAENIPTSPPQRLAKRVLTPQNTYLMTSLMRDVIQHGTGRRARQLGRKDIAGKTGTTNDAYDAWFSGFNADIVTICWVGFDQSRSLGNHETGGRAALPMWIDFMKVALKDLPEKSLERPPGLVTVRIDPVTGLLAGTDNPKAIFETFRVEDVPRQSAVHRNTGSGSAVQEDMPEQLF